MRISSRTMTLMALIIAGVTVYNCWLFLISTADAGDEDQIAANIRDASTESVVFFMTSTF